MQDLTPCFLELLPPPGWSRSVQLTARGPPEDSPLVALLEGLVQLVQPSRATAQPAPSVWIPPAAIASI